MVLSIFIIVTTINHIRIIKTTIIEAKNITTTATIKIIN
jgi:hypothetical protein